MKKNWLWLIILIWMAAALRLAWLDQQSLWYDEGVTWMLSQMPLTELINWTAADIQPPLYYLIIWTTDILFSDSEWALRFPSAVFGILTVPMLYTLARRLSYLNRQTNQPANYPASFPFLAAFLLTLSPLMIYYSQEARMYTLLTFEAVLLGYLLLQLLHPTTRPLNPSLTRLPSPRGRGVGGEGLASKESQNSNQTQPSILTSLLYAIVGAAALYTHYFAAFLLVAHGIYALIILWRNKFSRTLLLPIVIAFGGSIVLFTPWLPILLARLGDDPSYWPGALKIDETIRKVAISFIAGETIIEQTGWWLTLAFLTLVIISVLGLLLTSFIANKPSNHPTIQLPNLQLFSMLWLFVPLILILILSYQSPKFNPRYTLLVWPAGALLLAQLLTNLIVSSNTPRFTFYASRVLFALILIFFLAISTFSLYNSFSDPRFSKDHFRALAKFVQERESPNETVLLSSGHLFPVWAYYYGWDGWTPLPWMLSLDVEQVTNLNMADTIAEAVEGQEGVWLVTWQDEVIDPTGVVPFWLDTIGERPHDAGDFWGVGLEHWRLNPRRISLLQENPIKRETEINFANQITLLGYTQPSDTELILFWQPQQALPDELILTLDLFDSDGFNWSREAITNRLGSDIYPPSRWPVGEVVITHHHLPWQIGTPPGLYRAEIGLGVVGSPNNTASAAGEFSGWDILDAQGRPQRRTALLESINLSDLVEPDSGPLPQAKNPVIDLFPIIGLRRSIPLQTSAQPGDRIQLALLWQAGEYNVDNVSLAFDLVDSKGEVYRIGHSLTPSRQFNLPRWQPGDMVLGQYWLDIPPEAAPGPANLQLHIINVSGYPYDEVFTFDDMEIMPTERNFNPPQQMDITLAANFSDQVTLIGADCAAGCQSAAGESLSLTLYWRAENNFDTSYTIFTHALDSDETVVINADHSPPKPTTGWVPNEIITDPITLTIPIDLPLGEYPIEVGLYDASDPAFARLPLEEGDSRVVLPQPLKVTE
ncbi:MAG: glycosyltransferase family 39 protein [Anaerolineae bacterium]|nr:glycosyltransferase family 39 protein [Anaerolineae bacterium]